MGDPFSYNGGSMLAMKGEQCVAIATDRRLGAQFQTVATNFQKVFRIQDNILLGLTGLATDVQTFHRLIQYKVNLYRLRENKDIKVNTFVNLISATLYEKRWGPYFVQPIVAGLEYDDVKGVIPITATYDSIGCTSIEGEFQVGGTGADGLIGSCESFWRQGLKPDELEDIVAQSLTAGCDRDILSGWGGVVYTLTKDNLSVKVLKTKQS
ncbi:hypothetical protein ABPG74_011667 [Tetrahymena malaccensis]